MVKNKLSRLIALGLSLAMITSLAACGSDKKEESKESIKDSTQKQEERKTDAVEKTEEKEEEPIELIQSGTDAWFLQPYEETKTVSIGAFERPNIIYTQEGDDQTKNIWTRDFKDKLNVELQVDWLTQDLKTRINLDMAENNLPDIFQCDYTTLQQLLEADMLMDITEVYDTYASDRVKALHMQDKEIFETGKVDDRLYAMPRMNSGTEMSGYLWLREDWLEDLGLEAPTTIDELEELLLAFMEYSGSEYAIPVTKDLGYFKALSAAWGVDNGTWFKNDEGKLIKGSVLPQMKEVIATYADWYQKGIIKQDWYTETEATATEDVVNGVVGAAIHLSWYCHTDVTSLLANTGEYMFPYELPSATGEKVKYPMNFNNAGYTVISKNCENPDAAIKLYNYQTYVQYDALNDGYMDAETVDQYVSNERCFIYEPFSLLNTSDLANRYINTNAAFEAKDISMTTDAVQAAIYGMFENWLADPSKENTANYGGWLQNYKDIGSYAHLNNVIEEDRWMKNALWGPTPKEVNDYGGSTGTIWLEAVTKIIIGEEPIDYFDEMVEEWYAAGGQEMTDAVNEMYNK